MLNSCIASLRPLHRYFGAALGIGLSLLVFGHSASAQDAATSLLLRFDDALAGHTGQLPVSVPSAPGISYQPGTVGRAAVIPATGPLSYAAAGNISATQGTLEFWVKPNWAGNDGQNHVFLAWGSGGGMLFSKDGANNLRCIFNRFGVGGQPERGTAINVSSWSAGAWRHVAYTWSNTSRVLELYVDGIRVNFSSFTGTLPTVDAAAFHVASENGFNGANAMIDQLRISATVRTSAEILDSVRAGPLLNLRFENSLAGDAGETPSPATGATYEAGVAGQGVLLGTPNSVFYPAANNILSGEGTLEFWMKPRWNGNDGITRVVAAWGGGGGMLFAKDGANNLRSIFNRFSVGGQPERGVAMNINSWVANTWHHVAYTWSNTSRTIEMYVDGTRVSQAAFTGSLPVISNTTFQLGGDGAGGYANAVFDQFRITGRARTASEISDSFVSGLTVSSLSISPNTMSMYPTWRRLPTLSAVTNVGAVSLPAAGAAWATTDATVAMWDGSRIRAVGPGSATLTAFVGAASATVTVNVTAPVRQPDVTVISPALATPASCYQWEMPVAVLRYIPTLDGVNVDSATAAWNSSIDSLQRRIDRMEIDTKFMLEEGSRFRGYGSQAASPSLGYRIVAIINVYEPLPPDFDPSHSTGSAGVYYPDYYQILERFDAGNWVNNLGVKEVWLWGYHNGSIAPVESNMSSPTTGDISNSYRFNDDLPVYSKSYMLYNYNFTRSQAEAVHNHGHQLESILGYAAGRQDGNANLFWRQFVGQNTSGQFITGRAGWTHMPPNTTANYDYENPAVVQSDIRDWTPAGSGVRQPTSASTWGNMAYSWPGGIMPPQQVESQFYMFWMQSMPGRGNTIANGSGFMTNWWWFTADWDTAIGAVRSGWGLYSLPGSAAPAIAAQPQSISTRAGLNITLSVSASGGLPLTYQWFHDGVPLCNGGRISGACSAALSLRPAVQEDTGVYTVVVTGPGGFTPSAGATVTIGPIGCWLADVTPPGGDGIIDGNDFIAFVNSFGVGDPAVNPIADVAGGGIDGLRPDEIIDGNDFVAFINAFAVGC